MAGRRRSCLTVVSLAALISSAALVAGDAKGTLSYKTNATDYVLELKYAYLIKRPDPFDPKATSRSLVFTTRDIAAEIKACAAFSCVNGALSDSLHVDLVKPFLTFWLVLNNQRVQTSGPVNLAALETTVDTPTRVAGRLTFAITAGGGPKVDVEFDAALVKDFTIR